MSAGLLGYRVFAISINGETPISTHDAMSTISKIFSFVKDFVSFMVSAMAVTVVFMLIGTLYMDFETTRETFLSMTNEEFQSSIHMSLRLGFVLGLGLFAGKFLFFPKYSTPQRTRIIKDTSTGCKSK